MAPSNFVFNNPAFSNDPASVTSQSPDHMTVADTVKKTAALFAVLAVAAVVGHLRGGPRGEASEPGEHRVQEGVPGQVIAALSQADQGENERILAGVVAGVDGIDNVGQPVGEREDRFAAGPVADVGEGRRQGVDPDPLGRQLPVQV